MLLCLERSSLPQSDGQGPSIDDNMEPIVCVNTGVNKGKKMLPQEVLRKLRVIGNSDFRKMKRMLLNMLDVSKCPRSFSERKPGAKTKQRHVGYLKDDGYFHTFMNVRRR